MTNLGSPLATQSRTELLGINGTDFYRPDALPVTKPALLKHWNCRKQIALSTTRQNHPLAFYQAPEQGSTALSMPTVQHQYPVQPTTHITSVRLIPCWRPIPDTIGCSCTDTDIDTDTGNDVTYTLGHVYVTHVVHSVYTFQNITSLTLCFQTYIWYAYTRIAY